MTRPTVTGGSRRERRPTERPPIPARRIATALGAGGLLAGSLWAGSLWAGTASPASSGDALPPIVIATGPVAGFSYPLGGEICRLYEQPADLQHPAAGAPAPRAGCSASATSGSVDDLERLRAGEIDLAVVQSDRAADAATGSGPFAGKAPMSELRSLLGFYGDALTILVRADGPIRAVADLKGKRLAVGVPGTPDPLFAEFLEGLGWTASDLGGTVEMQRDDQLGALCGRKVDAVALTAPSPNGFVRAALAACPVKLLDLAGPGLDATLAAHRSYARIVLDPATYGPTTYGGAGGKVQSFGPRAVLVALARLPDPVARRLAAAVFDRFDTLRQAHPAFAGLGRTEVVAASGLGAPRHDAVAKFLAERKLVPPASGE